jgi:hypothetical protein
MRKDLIINDNLNIMQFVGVVVDINDPLKLGRIKVKVFGKFDDLETEAIPWSVPANGFTSGSKNGSGFFSLPKLESTVNVIFDNGNIYYPMYTTQQEISTELLSVLSEDDYAKTQSLIYDSENLLKIWFLPSKGLLLELDKSFINIKPDNTILLTANGGKTIHIQKDEISIGKENKSDEPAVLGEKNVKALSEILNRLETLCDKLIQYSTTQSTLTSSVFIFAPLTAALSKLSIDVSAIKASLLPIKNVTIPQTRSSTITVDGPPKN